MGRIRRRDRAKGEVKALDEELDEARIALANEFSPGGEKAKGEARIMEEELDKARLAVANEFSPGRDKAREEAGSLDEEIDKTKIAVINELTQQEDLKEVEVEELGGGLNEATPPNEVPFRDCLIADNIRVSEDGRTKEKRSGLTKLDSIYDFVSKKIYGAFGIEESDEVKIAAFLEDDIQLKSGNEWGSIFSPTKKINKPVSVVQDKGLVLVAGYEKLITIKEGQAHYSGIEAPESAPTVKTEEEVVGEKKTAEYPETHQDHCGELGQAAAQTLLAQSFKVAVDCELTKIELKLKKVGSPTESLWAEIHQTRSGTLITKGNSPGIVENGATDNLDVSTIKTSFVKVTDTSIAFVSSTKKIKDTNNGLAVFLTGDKIKVTGSEKNNGIYTVATGGVAGEIVVDEDLIDEDAGDSITIETIYELAFSGTKPSLDKEKTYYLVIYRSFDVSTSDYVVVGFDNSGHEYEEGKYWQIDGSFDWGGYASVDIVFEIHGVNKEEQSLLSFGSLETGSFLRLKPDKDHFLLSQSFIPENNCDLTKVKIALKRVRLTTKNVWVEIHSSTVGTKKTKEDSTKIVGDASDNISTDDIPEDYTWIEFIFSGTKPSLAVYTTNVDQLSSSGQKILYVASTENFVVGGIVVIGRGTPREEIKVIESIQSGEFLTMTEKLTYSHPSAQEDLVENSYCLVLYTDATTVPKGIPVVSWTLHEGYDGGIPWLINDSMNWTKYGLAYKDLSFEIFGYETDEQKLLEYALSNHDDIKELREANGATLLAQEFLVYEDTDVTKVKLYLSKVGSLTGKFIWAEIHRAQGGTSESEGLSDEIVGKASATVDANSLSAFPEYGWVTFTFSVKPDIKAETIYYIVIYGDFDVSSSNYVKVGMDKIDPTYTVGKRWDIDSDLEWTAKEGIDFMFELWTSISDILGEYSYVITYERGGNYPCESNPSPPSETIELTTGNVAKLTNIPVSSESEVTHKNIYRTKAALEVRYWVDRILNSVTTYTDSLPDSGLGDEVSYESYPPPIGDSIEIWDDCLWVCGVEGYPESLFRSRRGYLEQFKSTALSIFPLREDEASPVLRIKEFNNYLYPFKKTSIWVISRSGTELVVDKLIDGIGTVAGASVAECGDKKLRFLSNYYEIEEFNGFELTSMELPNKVKKTLKSINKTYAHRSVAKNHAEENEYRLAIPTGSSMVPNKVIVCNYKDKNFFIDTYHQNICSISALTIEKGVRAILYGTEEGELYKVDADATTDDGQLINMRFRTGWIGSQSWMKLRKMWIDFILPENKILVFKVYSNFRDSPELSINLEGSTPTGANPELRNVIHKRIDMAVKGNFFSFELINTQDVGDLLQVIKFWLYLKTRPSKRTVQAE